MTQHASGNAPYRNRSVGHESAWSSLEAEESGLITKLRLYESCVCTLLKANISRLQAFKMRSLRHIRVTRWFDLVTIDVEVTDCTFLEDVQPRIQQRRTLFGHVDCIQSGISAHNALWDALGVRCGSALEPGWKRPSGRHRNTWAEQLRRDLDGVSPSMVPGI